MKNAFLSSSHSFSIMNWLGGFTRNEERQPREVSRTVAEASSSSQRSDFSMEGKIGLKILCEAQGSADGFGVEYVYLETQ